MGNYRVALTPGELCDVLHVLTCKIADMELEADRCQEVALPGTAALWMERRKDLIELKDKFLAAQR